MFFDFLARHFSHDSNCDPWRHWLHGLGADQAPAAASGGRDCGPDQPTGGGAADRHDPSVAQWPPGTVLGDLSPQEVASRAECVFSCLPHGASAAVVPQLLDAGCRVVDFSADYRLNDPRSSLSGTARNMPTPSGWGRSSMGCPSCSARRSWGRRWWPTRAAFPRRHPGLGPAAQGGRDRPPRDRGRFQERRLGGRTDAETDDPLPGVQREHLGLQRGAAPPHAGDRPNPQHCGGDEGRSGVHAAPGPHGPRHPDHDLQPAPSAT